MNEVKNKFSDVYDYITTEETDFKTRRIPLGSNWEWNMKEHIDRSFLMKNSQYSLGSNDFANKRPFKNIIIPIASVNYRSEGFDVKDIQVFVDDPDNFHKSLLARKFHTKWALKYSIDTAIDDSAESYFDYGLTLAKNVNEERPEIVPLQMIAFCDQTDILGGPICLKHQYSIDGLLDMKGKWYADEIDMTVLMAEFNKTDNSNKDAKTPGKYIEVYELHGTFPDTWLDSKNYEAKDDGSYTKQIHIVTYYVDPIDAKKKGLCLFKGKEPKAIFKCIIREPIFGRACGRGGIEELFDSQIFTNYSEIHLQQMLEVTSKVIIKTTDKKFAQNNKIGNLKQGQILEIEEGKMAEQMVLQPFNKAAFDNYVNAWEQNARTIGSASDPQLGLNPTSGTPLGTTQIVTDQGEGIHDYRRGKLATFWGEIYRDWVLQYLVNEMNKGDKWLDELSVDELREVGEKIAVNETNKKTKELFLQGRLITQQEQAMLLQAVKDQFSKGGKKKFLEIMKGEFKNLPMDVEFSIAGKQKNLAQVVQKLNGIFSTIFTNPAVLQAPGMAELFNDILESSGLSPLDFTSLTTPPPQPANPERPPADAVPSPYQTPQLQPNQT